MRFFTLLICLGVTLFPLPALAKQLKVAVIDTGLNLKDERFAPVLCKSGHKDYTGVGLKDTHGHGTHVVGLIKQYAGDADYCLLILKFYDEAAILRGAERMTSAINYAVAQGADIVNISGGGPTFMENEYYAIKRAKRTTFIVAAGNDGLNLDVPGNDYYPASYRFPNIITVGSLDLDGARSSFSNYGSFIHDWEIGEDVVSTGIGSKPRRITGTSQSTAIATGKFLFRTRRSIHPKARQ